MFEDVLCQMHDMIQPAQEGFFTLQDLRRAKALAGTLFNILFNLQKFVAFETRDPFLIRQVDLLLLLCILQHKADTHESGWNISQG